MKYIKQIISMLVAIALIFTLASCAKCISTETSTVEVKVIDKYYRGAYVTPVNCGKSIAMITHPAVYKIMVEYEGNAYAFYGIDTYTKYVDKVGDNANAILEAKKYDDGTVKYNITTLE